MAAALRGAGGRGLNEQTIKASLRYETQNPLLAAILNFVLPGVGYLYAGRRIVFAVLLFIGNILGIFAAFDMNIGAAYFIASVIISAAFALDAWNEAERANSGTL